MRKARDLVKSVPRSFSTARTPTPAQMDPSDRYCYNPVLRWNPQVEAYFSKAYGPHHFSRITQALARPSCYSCIRVNTLKSTSDAVIEKLLEIIQETELGNTVDGMHLSESNATAKIDMGGNLKSSLREYNSHLNLDEQKKVAFGNFEQLDSQKKSLETGSISKCQLPGLDYVVFVRGSGPHTIEYGYEIDRPPKEVIVSRKCAEAVLRGAQVYVPGVLACSSHVEKGDVVAVSVAVEQPGTDGGWGVGITRGTVLQGQQTDPYHFERNALYIGQGATMMSRAGIFRASGGIAVDMNNRVFKLPSFHDVLEGEIFLQNLPSIVTAHALDPQQDERILDMCAAPGGKTTAIAILMKDQGEVIAVDRSHNKVMDIQKLAAEMGLHCITTYKLDALKAVCRSNESNDMTTPSCRKDAEGVTLQSSDSPRLQMEKNQCSTEAFAADFACQENVINGEGNQRTYTSKADIRKNIRRMRNGPGRNQGMGGRVEKSKGFSPNSFDRVLLDAPCSALGLRPRLFAGEETIESLRNHAKYQRRMFDQAVQLVRPGGVIVYSTLVCILMKSVYHAFEKTQKLFKKRKNLLPQTIAIIICGGDLSMLTFISYLCYTLIIYWLQLIYTYVYLSMLPFIFNFSLLTTTETLYFTEMRLRSKFP